MVAKIAIVSGTFWNMASFAKGNNLDNRYFSDVFGLSDRDIVVFNA